MRRMYLATIILATAILATIAVPTMTGSVARAEVIYPWCAYYGGRGGLSATNCGFTSWAQCMATVSGIGGYCGFNPSYQEAAARARRRR